jgi:hypothetical protein
MSMAITDEQLQTIRDRYPGTLANNSYQSDMRALLQAISERDATIAELRLQSSLDAQRRKEAEMLIHLEQAELAKARAELDELRKPVEESEVIDLAALVEQIAAYNCSLTEEQTEKLYRCASLLQRLESQVYQLRKPVAVEKTEAVNKAQNALRYWLNTEPDDDYDAFVDCMNSAKALSIAYEALAQDHARAVNAREMGAAELRGLRERPESREKVLLERDAASGRAHAAAVELATVQSELTSTLEEMRGLRDRLAKADRDIELLKLMTQTMEDCIAPADGRTVTFEDRAEELIVTEVQHEASQERERQLQQQLDHASDIVTTQEGKILGIEEHERQSREALEACRDVLMSWGKATIERSPGSDIWPIVCAALATSPAPVESEREQAGKRCTCDTSRGGSIPCYVESGGKLGDLWYCAKARQESGNG